MDDILRREIESQLSLETELLLRKLGSESAIGSVPGTARDGKAILENAKRKLRDKLCADDRVRNTYSASDSSRVLLVAAVLDCVGGAITGVSPLTVAVLLVREGIETVCKDVWRNEA